MSEEKKMVRKPIATAADAGKYMAKYYYELDNAAKTGEKKIAWCTSVGPAEILRAMGYLVYFPETHAAMLGATRMATDMIPHATALGYSPEICSYLTADIGAFVKGITPLAKAYKGIESVPKPDILVFNTNQCRDVQDWFDFFAKKYNVPSIGVSGNVGVKNVTIDDYFFKGHFPGRPVMPGVLIIEAMAQVGGVMMLSPPENRGKIAYFMAINNAKFRKTVVPGDRLILSVEAVRVKARTGQVRATTTVNGKVVAEADLMFALVER